MSSNFDVRVYGLKETQKQLRSFGAEATELKAAWGKGSNILANSLRVTTPRRTGALAATIRPARLRASARARIGRSRPLHYAPFPNFGTKRQGAQKFTKRAADRARRPAIAVVKSELSKLVSKYSD